MTVQVGDMVEIRTTYGNIVGVLVQMHEISRKCKVLTTKGGFIESDECYLVPYNLTYKFV
tara:strand:- start:555 stop:734 length:180 start_codon:yes stop_codon:yes gene_type:complete